MSFASVITAPNLEFTWLVHGFGLRDSTPPASLTTARQIHSAVVLDACGRQNEQLGEGDAIISTEAGVAIGIRTADCVPILVADSATRIVACVHAGWRGTAANIVGNTVQAFLSHGCRARDLHVAIGPSIGSCCYNVGDDISRQFETWLPESTGAALYATADQIALDLPAINEAQLKRMGVANIWKSGECTFCNPSRFFSFRRDKEQAGRMLSFVNRVA